MPHHYLIAMGSNLGDRRAHIESALLAIRARCGTITKRAAFFENPPMGNADQWFLNTAIILKTTLEPLALLKEILAIETENGRERSIHWGNRTIDLDLILWKDAHGDFSIFNHPTLAIPHPRMTERDFVLVPACEIASEWQHPFYKKTLQVLLVELTQARQAMLPRKETARVSPGRLEQYYPTT